MWRISLVLFGCLGAGCDVDQDVVSAAPYIGAADGDITIETLESLSVESLRQREYGTVLTLESQIGDRSGASEYAQAYGESGDGPYDTFMASYDSDGLRLYTRIDIPNAPMPTDGYPVVIFCHGWVGIDAAPTFHFSHTPKSMYAELIDGYVDAGFVVLTPGYRGHGEVNGVPADGIEFMAAWDNATYISPIFYAIDVLNLLEGMGAFEQLDFDRFPQSSTGNVRVDLNRVHLSGHSQGGDVVLNALAIAGEGGNVSVAIAGAAISDGTFPDRRTQIETFPPMQASPEAFMAGDGKWNGGAVGADGSVNPNFIFGYPPDWIVTADQNEWTWQNDTWSMATVADALRPKLDEMYVALNAQVDNLSDADYVLHAEAGKRFAAVHDPRVTAHWSSLGAFHHPEYLTEPLVLHYSDQDMYSLPAWNSELCSRINGAGGACQHYLYPANNHLMRLSEHKWYSPEGSVESYGYILRRDVALFSGADPADVTYP